MAPTIHLGVRLDAYPDARCRHSEVTPRRLAIPDDLVHQLMGLEASRARDQGETPCTPTPKEPGQTRSNQLRSFPFGATLHLTDRWLSVEEIAEHLGISKDTVYAWIAKRQMPAHKVGRLWKFQRVEVDSWVKAGGAIDDAGKHES